MPFKNVEGISSRMLSKPQKTARLPIIHGLSFENHFKRETLGETDFSEGSFISRLNNVLSYKTRLYFGDSQKPGEISTNSFREKHTTICVFYKTLSTT
jgi:hypothetical protein